MSKRPSDGPQPEGKRQRIQSEGERIAEAAAERLAVEAAAMQVEPAPAPVLAPLDISEKDRATLAICDTIHDFWKERTRKSDGSVSSGDSVVSVSRLEAVQDKIQEVLQTKPGPAGQTAEQIVLARTGGKVSNLTSDFQWKVVRYFEIKLGLVEKESLLTFEDILAGDINIPLLGNCLEITSSTGLPIDSISLDDRKRIGNFLLTYLSPTFSKPGDEQRAFTFDAGEGPIGKIFGTFDQVVNYLFPQNIADSAVSTLKPLQGRCVAQPNEKVVTSNYFTGPDIAIAFKNNGFSRQNPYGFSIQVTEGAKTANIAFSAENRQGPSVNYLADLMVPPLGGAKSQGMADLTELRTKWPENNGLLLDLKRMGDHEQVNASLGYPECCLSTIDILCSLYARMRRKSCILHTPYTLRMYRFDANIDPNLQILRREIFRSQQNLGKLKTILNYLTTSEGILSDLDKVIELFRIGRFAQLKDGKHKILNAYDDNADPGDLALTVVTRLLNYRMNDLYNRATVIKTAIENFRSEENIDKIREDAELLQKVVRLTSADGVISGRLLVDGNDIAVHNYAIENIFNVIPNFRELEFPLKLSGDPVSVYQMVFTKTGDTYYLKRAGSIPAFRFSCQPYKNMVNSLQTLLQLSRATRVSPKFTIETAATFFASRDAEKEAFVDPAVKAKVEEAADFAIPNDANIKVAVPEMVKRIFAQLPPLEQKGGDGEKVSSIEADVDTETERSDAALAEVQSKAGNNAWHPLMYYDLDDLFAEICSMAATTVNSIVATASELPVSKLGEPEPDAPRPAEPGTPPPPGTRAAPPSLLQSERTSQASSERTSQASSEASSDVSTPPSPKRQQGQARQTLAVITFLMNNQKAVDDAFLEIVNTWEYGYNSLVDNAEDVYGMKWDPVLKENFVLETLNAETEEERVHRLVLLTIFDNFRYTAWSTQPERVFTDYYNLPKHPGKYDSREAWGKLENDILLLLSKIKKAEPLSAEDKLLTAGNRRKTYRNHKRTRRHTYRR